jgi:hypothetical protein
MEPRTVKPPAQKSKISIAAATRAAKALKEHTKGAASTKKAAQEKPSDAAKRLAGEKVLECAQNLTPELAALNRAARRYNKLLSRDVSAPEIAVLAIPATALLESLGILFNCKIKPIKTLSAVKTWLGR